MASAQAAGLKNWTAKKNQAGRRKYRRAHLRCLPTLIANAMCRCFVVRSKRRCRSFRLRTTSVFVCITRKAKRWQKAAASWENMNPAFREIWIASGANCVAQSKKFSSAGAQQRMDLLRRAALARRKSHCALNMSRRTHPSTLTSFFPGQAHNRQPQGGRNHERAVQEGDARTFYEWKLSWRMKTAKNCLKKR